jgi:membrane protease YdiL (CAAX protease family)
VLLPRTPGERRGFAAVSITAGICEELLFRGFLMWYFAGWGIVAAVVVSSLLFGFAHIYQGIQSVPRTGILGLVLCLIVVAAGSLWPAIIIHAAIDLNSGDLGYRALSGAKPQS